MGALICIWTSVVAISLFAPDLVSGSQQEHLPVAAFGTWLWGAIATQRMFGAMWRIESEDVRRQLAGFVSVVWVAAALVAILAPEMVTGSDPTRLPIAALLAPVAAAVLTTGAVEMASAVRSPVRGR